MNNKQKILEYLKNNTPKTVYEIAIALGLPERIVIYCLHNLENEDLVFHSDGAEVTNGTLVLVKKYAARTKAGIEKDSDESKTTEENAATYFNKYKIEMALLERKQEKIQESLEKATGRIYSDFIALLGIFVAIFAVIIINIDALKNLWDKCETFCDVMTLICIVDGALILTLSIMLLAIWFFILRKQRNP